jgi:hypothetical protein
MLAAMLLVTLPVLRTGARVLGRGAVMLGGGRVIARRFVGAGRQVMGVRLRVGIGVAVLEQQQENRKGEFLLATIDVSLGGL